MKITNLGSRRIKLAVAVAFLSGSAGWLSSRAEAAERKYGLAGCGLGSLVIKPSGNQSTAALLNSTGYNMFAITSGTSNCVPASKAGADVKQQDFFVSNFETLSKEIAQGGGDAVIAFAGTLGCESGASGTVAGQLQGDYDQIFAAPGAVAAFEEAKDSLRTVPGLTTKCVNL